MNRIGLRSWSLALIGVLLVAAIIGGAVLIKPSTATAQNEPNSGEPEQGQSTKTFTCNISEIAVHVPDRIHLRCNPGDGTISFFAASSSSANITRANQFLTLANTAYALGKTINIWYETDQSENPPGCLTSDCRKIIALVLKP